MWVGGTGWGGWGGEGVGGGGVGGGWGGGGAGGGEGVNYRMLGEKRVNIKGGRGDVGV